ncbi:nucleosome assembly protein 1-like 1 [Anopheles merus]|uniref:nucleosome assembly protein 1-like 1 n=1 Tax=Anopheles merus TaxID=30066 RepID=UPI001BE4A884|nr:nucleosome assembly protein 1-like 1 [Anopheles merus]
MADNETNEAVMISPSVPSPTNEETTSLEKTEQFLLHQISVIEKRIKEIELAQSTASSPVPPNIQAKLYALRKIQLDIVEREVKFHLKAHEMEVQYQAEFAECHDKIARIVNGLDVPELTESNPAPNDAADQPTGVPEFWLTVLKSSFLEHMIQERDEPVLKQLQDIRVMLVSEPVPGFELLFSFAPNEYFANEVLSKKYFLRCAPNPDAPAKFNGFEIYSCEGCTIDWKDGHNLVEAPGSSFFDFFNPESMTNADYDADFNEAIMECDFQYGYHIKETIIPRAVFLFLKENINLGDENHFTCCCDRCVYIDSLEDLGAHPALDGDDDGDDEPASQDPCSTPNGEEAESESV